MLDKVKDTPSGVVVTIAMIKGFAKYLVIPSGAIMFVPDDWLAQFRLLDVKNSYGQWAAILFWISISIVTIDIGQQCLEKIASAYQQKQLIKKFEKSLENLNFKEWRIISLIYKHDSYSFNSTDASVSSLMSLKIITCSRVSYSLSFSYTLQPWVRTYLKKHPERINSFAKEMRTELNEYVS